MTSADGGQRARSGLHVEDDPEARLAAHHALLGLLRFLERIDLVIEATLLRRLKSTVSSESRAIPEYQPLTAALLMRRSNELTVSGPTAPITLAMTE